MINVMGEDFAEFLSGLFNGEDGDTDEESEDIAYYTSGEYGFFGCDYSPYGLTEEDRKALYRCLSVICDRLDAVGTASDISSTHL